MRALDATVEVSVQTVHWDWAAFSGKWLTWFVTTYVDKTSVCNIEEKSLISNLKVFIGSRPIREHTSLSFVFLRGNNICNSHLRVCVLEQQACTQNRNRVNCLVLLCVIDCWSCIMYCYRPRPAQRSSLLDGSFAGWS